MPEPWIIALAIIGGGVVFLVPWCVGIGVCVTVIGELELWNEPKPKGEKHSAERRPHAAP